MPRSLARYTGISQVDFSRWNTSGSAGNFLTGLFISIDIAAEQALDMGIYIICFRMYPRHLHDAMPGLIIPNFQARYFGLSSVMYVYACCDTYQLILDRFTRINAFCVFTP